jgi:hypothetical protein
MSREPFEISEKAQKSLITVTKIKITPLKTIIKIDKNLCHHFNHRCNQRAVMIFSRAFIFGRAISNDDLAMATGRDVV